MERVDGALRKRFLGLTGPMGRRVVVAADALGHTFGVRVLKMDRPDGRKVLKFDGPSGRGLRIALRAILIKSALRIYLSASYVMKSITVISHLRWLSPLWCLTARPSPREAGKGECISIARRAVVKVLS